MGRPQAAGEAVGEPKVKSELLDIHRAYQLHAAASPQTTIVQARLLAGQSPEEIGPQVSLTPATVKAYEAVFFNVADRLEAKVYILKAGVGWSGTMAVTGCDLDVVVRSLAYYGGLVALEAAIPVLLPQAARWCPAMASIEVDSELAAKIRSLAGVLMMPIRNDKDAMKIMQLHVRLIESTQAGGTSEDLSLDGIFDDLVRDKVAEMSEKCFEPQPEREDEPLQEVRAEESAAVDAAASCEVA
jgi:hypothetical protein